MTIPRSHQINLLSTCHYHCISRCVRKAYLCGKSFDNTKDYEHRRGWVESRLLYLSNTFMINIAAYAVMHNHYHVILSVNRKACMALTQQQVVERWHSLFLGNKLSHDFLEGKVTASQAHSVDKLIESWRDRLMSISWFMRAMNENIAKRANAEDNCTGRFWEGRFKSQALLDDKALLACMAYVDLNPFRAGIATSLENAVHTSIKRRINQSRAEKAYKYSASLLGFLTDRQDDAPKVEYEFTEHVIPIKYNDYKTLLNQTIGVLYDKNNLILLDELTNTLNLLGIEYTSWVELTSYFEGSLKTLVGGMDKLRNAYQQFSMKRIAGINACKRLFGPG